MMEINIKMMTEEAYATLQKNPKDVYKNIMDHPSDATWLADYLGFEPYETKKYIIDDFELENSENYSDVIVNNSIAIYEHLKELPRYVLCNPRFWAWFTFEKAYKQAQNATKITGEKLISSTWLITSARRSLMLGVISREFFIVMVSNDDSREDKYELTRYLLSNSEAYRNIVYRNIGMLKNVTLALLAAEKKVEDDNGIKLSKAHSRNIMKEASKIGSVMLIDVMSKEEIYNIIYPKVIKISSEV